MIRPRRRRVVVSVPAATGLLIAAAVAYAATSSGYSGRTSQRQPISFQVSRGYVRQLDYRIVDKCSRGQKLINHDFGFSPIQVSHSKFGGTFADPKHHGKAVVTGMLKGRMVQGTLSDRTRNAKTGKFCSGKAAFKIRRR